MTKPFLLIIFLLINCSLIGQISIPDFSFKDSTERTTLMAFDKSNAFELMCLVDLKDLRKEEISIEKLYFLQFLDRLEPKINKRKKKKTCQTIYQAIHDEYFYLYKEGVVFTEIITDGYYNCATATAMYALALEHLGIDYQIIQVPSHVYLIAYPDSEAIIFESTTPSSGITEWNKQSNYAIKKRLYSDKIITRAQLKDNNYVHKNYRDAQSISLKAMLGILYSNNSLNREERGEHFKSLQQNYIAFALNKTEGVKTNLEGSILNYLEESAIEAESEMICHAFSVLEQSTGDYKPRSAIKHFAGKINEAKVETEEGRAYLKELNDCLNSTLKNSNILTFLNDGLYLNLISQAYKQGHTNEILKYANKLSNDAKFKREEIIGRLKFDRIVKMTDFPKLADSLIQFKETYPAIAKEEAFKEFEIFVYIQNSYQNFANDNYKKGTYYLDLFRKGDFKSMVSSLNVDIIGGGYAAASSYYVRANKYEKAKELLIEGIEFTGGSFELKEKLKLLKDFNKGVY